jgi:hypothetical protein
MVPMGDMPDKSRKKLSICPTHPGTPKFGNFSPQNAPLSHKKGPFSLAFPLKINHLAWSDPIKT